MTDRPITSPSERISTSVTIHIDIESLIALNTIARDRGITRSKLMREILVEWISTRSVET